MVNCFSPRQLALQAGESEYFKFYYHGPRDNRERYYRVSFREVPTRNQTRRSPTGGVVSTGAGGGDGYHSGSTTTSGSV